jgi:hypothetical protein
MAAAMSCIDLGLELTETVSLRTKGLDLSTLSFLRSVVQLAVRFNIELEDFFRGNGTMRELLMLSSVSTDVLMGCGELI